LIKLLLADDHTILRKGLRLLLEREPDFSIVAEANNGREAISSVASYHPDVVIMDIAMPVMNGIEAAQRICQEHPRTAIIILSAHSDEGYVMRALQAGARGYLLKDSADNDLCQAVRAVLAGKSYFSPAVSRILADDYLRKLRQQTAQDPYDLLTPREREILQLVAELKPTVQIAELLGLSPHTVDTHRSNMMQKLKLHSVPEVILYAVRKGIIK
jgi:DNA-binding NarL/FixJ family response regulator